MHVRPRVLCLLPLLFSLCVASISKADAGTIAVTGSLSSRSDYEDQISLFLPSGMSTLTVRIPIPSKINSFAFVQEPGPVSVTASRTPTSETVQTDDRGNRYHVFVFDHPAPGPLVVRSHVPQMRVTSDLDHPLPFVSLPLPTIPADVMPYLQPSKMVQSDAEPFALVAGDLRLGTHDEAAVADKITQWLSRTLTYGSSRAGTTNEDALSVFQSRRACCEGWAHLFLALARASGIPARFASGYNIAGGVTYPASTDGFQTLTITGLSQPHAWVELWFPGAGWVPYDPQSSSGFVDAHHVRTSTGSDAAAQEPFLSWVRKSGMGSPTYVETMTGGNPVDTNQLFFSYARDEPFRADLVTRAEATPPGSATDVAQTSRFTVW